MTGVIVFTTLDEMINFDKAKYVLWPNKSNREKLDRSLKIQLRNETDDPDLFAKLYREELIEQHRDKPEVEVVVKGETKLWFEGFRFPGDEDEYIAFLEAQYALSPNGSRLRKIERYRKARADGTPFHLVDSNDDN